MANFFQGQADFADSDGAVWHITLDFYAFAVAAKALCDGDIDALFAKLSGQADVLDMGHLLYGGLLRRHPKMTLPDAVNLLGDSTAALEALNEAITGALPDKAASTVGKAESPGIGATQSEGGQSTA